MKKFFLALLAVITVLLISSGFVIAGVTPNHTHEASDIVQHGGGLDSAGCHHDHQNGGYHCH